MYTIYHACYQISTFYDKSILKVYEGAPHGLTYTHKDKVNDDLLEFIKSWSYIYVSNIGEADGGIAPGTKFEDITDDWVCPVCGSTKSEFKIM